MTATQSTTVINPEGFIGYEYKQVLVPRKLASIYADYYPFFGWELQDTSQYHATSVSLTFKRNRKIKNKVEINSCQRQFEDSVSTISNLENSKTTRASIIAFTLGILGTVFMALATFSYLYGLIVACVILAIPGFAGWALSYVFYRKTIKKRTAVVEPQIDREFETLYSSCEKAHALSI